MCCRVFSQGCTASTQPSMGPTWCLISIRQLPCFTNMLDGTHKKLLCKQGGMALRPRLPRKPHLSLSFSYKTSQEHAWQYTSLMQVVRRQRQEDYTFKVTGLHDYTLSKHFLRGIKPQAFIKMWPPTGGGSSMAWQHVRDSDSETGSCRHWVHNSVQHRYYHHQLCGNALLTSPKKWIVVCLY